MKQRWRVRIETMTARQRVGHRRVTFACINARMSRRSRVPVTIASVATLAGVGALLLAGARLVGAFEQLRAVAAVPPAPTVASARRAETAAAPRDREPVAEMSAAAAPVTVAEASTDARAAAASGDEHILRMLAADAEFARAAEQLLNDPDVEPQEARQLLRDLGVNVPEAR